METRGHELSDVAVRLPLWGAVGVAAMVGIAFVICLLAFRVFVAREAPRAVENFPPLPRLQIEPTEELRQLRQEEDRKLSTYGWADRESGKVRVPIDRAIELQLQRGFPVRKEGGTR